MGNFKELFEAYGADYDTTMGRFMGNEKLYMRLFGMLFEDKNLENLGKSLEKQDLSGAFADAHTLKGVTANLGLTPYNQAVCEIVEPLRAGRNCDYDRMYKNILDEFQRVEELYEELKGGD